MKGLFGQQATEHEQVTLLLSAYIDGHVNARERAQVDKHLRACTACRANLATLRATVQAMQALPAARLPRSFTLPRSMARHPRPSWAFPIFRTATAVAAVLLILVIVGDLTGVAGLSAPVATSPTQPVSVAMEQPTGKPEARDRANDKTPEAKMTQAPEPPEPGYAEVATTPIEIPMSGGTGIPSPEEATPLAADMVIPPPDGVATVPTAIEIAVTTTLALSAHPVVASAPSTSTPTSPTALLPTGLTPEAATALPTATAQPSPAPMADAGSVPTSVVQIEPTAVAAIVATPTQPSEFLQVTPTASIVALGEAESPQTLAGNIPIVLLRAIEFGLAGLTILLGVSTLFTSGRVRWR